MGARRWVATRRTTVGAVLTALHESVEALAQGRVFVGRRRARSPNEVVEPREEVRVQAARPEQAVPEGFVLHDGGGLLVVDKPAGIPTIPDLDGASGSLLALAARATGRDVASLHPTSRLDRGVSGVVVLATDARAAGIVADARARGAYRRRYVALAAGEPPSDRMQWTWPIARARDPRLRRTVDARDGAEAKAAETRAVVVARAGRTVALVLAPVTGRTHQIRVHAARAGLPLLGDTDYGGPGRLTTPTGAVWPISRVALHCAAVEVRTPGGGCIISVRSSVPRELEELAAKAGFDPSPFARALDPELDPNPEPTP